MIKIAFDLFFKKSLFKPTYQVTSFDEIIDITCRDKIKYIIFDKDDTLTKLH